MTMVVVATFRGDTMWHRYVFHPPLLSTCGNPPPPGQPIVTNEG